MFLFEMNRLPCFLRPCCVLGTLLGLLLAAPALQKAYAQTAFSGLVGPTRDATTATVRTMMDGSHPGSASVQERYDAFSREFARDFGVVGNLGLVVRDASFVERVRGTLERNIGDTRVYGWLETSLLLYARMKAYTELERKGFDVEMEMDDMAEGKLGVRVARSLE